MESCDDEVESKFVTNATHCRDDTQYMFVLQREKNKINLKEQEGTTRLLLHQLSFHFLSCLLS